MNETDVAMFISGQFAELKDSGKLERHRIDPPVRELLRDGAGIPFEGWACFFNPESRSGVSFDPELKHFVLVVDGVAEGSFPSLKSVFENG